MKCVITTMVMVMTLALVASADVGDQLAKLTASDAAEYDYFGHSVAISGNTAIVGANLDADGGSGSGSAYLFEVPEPATLGLLLIGALALLRRRRSS